MFTVLTAAARAAEEIPHGEEGFPAIGYGIVAFVLLMAVLAVTLIFGKGREHS